MAVDRDPAYSVVDALKAELTTLPEELAQSSLAAACMRMAESLDYGGSLTAMGQTGKAYMELRSELLKERPTVKTATKADELKARRQARRAAG